MFFYLVMRSLREMTGVFLNLIKDIRANFMLVYVCPGGNRNYLIYSYNEQNILKYKEEKGATVG